MVVGALKQETVSLVCAVESHPEPLTFQWTFNNSGELVEVPQSRYIHVSPSEKSHSATETMKEYQQYHGSRLNYTPATEMDYGTVACRATNQVGRQLMPCLFQASIFLFLYMYSFRFPSFHLFFFFVSFSVHPSLTHLHLYIYSPLISVPPLILHCPFFFYITMYVFHFFLSLPLATHVADAVRATWFSREQIYFLPLRPPFTLFARLFSLAITRSAWEGKWKKKRQ